MIAGLRRQLEVLENCKSKAMISRNRAILQRKKYRFKVNSKIFTFWPEIFLSLKLFGFYNPKGRTVTERRSGWNAWTFLQCGIVCFQCLMAILSIISYFLYDTTEKSLFDLVDGLLPIMMMGNAIAYQAIIICKSNSFTKLLIHMMEASRKIDIKLDYKLMKFFNFIIILSVTIPILKATSFFCHMTDLERSNQTADYYSTKPYLFLTRIYIIIGNIQNSYYVIVIIAQIAIVVESIFGCLLIEFLILNILHVSNNFFKKSRKDLQQILKRQNEVLFTDFQDWMETYISISRLAEEIDYVLSPLILVFSTFVPCIVGMSAYETAQLSHMMPFLRWQSKLVSVFMILVYSIRITALSLKGQEFINEVSVFNLNEY